MKQSSRPELLAPAGSLEKLKVAVSYGADAVYLAGEKYSLREAADNFNPRELEEGIAFAHRRGAKVYVAINAFLHDKDISELPSFLELLTELKADAVIVSDMGVLETVRKHADLPAHLSTQASCLNHRAARLYKEMGVVRIILGREASIAEAAAIKREAQVEVELFAHGSQCMAYSGHCVISNYTKGRDANRGGCAHSCRFLYQIEGRRAHFMSSKDLNALALLPEFAGAGIDSLKIEGRMKGHYYTAVVTKAYAEALNSLARGEDFAPAPWLAELESVSHRSYYQGSLSAPAEEDSLYDQRLQEESAERVAAVVLEVRPDGALLVRTRGSFSPGDALELLPFSGAPRALDSSRLTGPKGEACRKTRPDSLALLPGVAGAQPHNLVRVRT